MAVQSQPRIVDRRTALHRIDPRQYVAQIAAAEIADVGAGKGFALSIGAARIGIEDEIALGDERRDEIKAGAVLAARRDITRPRRRRGSAMHDGDHRMLAGRDFGRAEQPALHIELVAFPVHALRRHGGGPSRIGARHRRQRGQPAQRDFRRMGEVLQDGGGNRAIGGKGQRVGEILAAHRYRGRPRYRNAFRNRIDGRGGAAVADQRGRHQLAAAPVQAFEGAFVVRRDIGRRAARQRHGIDIAADRTPIAHQAADEGDAFAVGRDARHVHLHLGTGDHPHPAAGVDVIQGGDPPIVVAIAFGGGGGKALAVRRPGIFIDIRIGGRDRLERAAGCGQHRDTLFVLALADLPDLRRGGLDRAGLLVRPQRHQQCDACAIGGKKRRVGDAGDHGQGLRLARGGAVQGGLSRFFVGGEEHKRIAFGRPDRTAVAAGGAGIVMGEDLAARIAHHHRAMRFVRQIARIVAFHRRNLVARGRQSEIVELMDRRRHSRRRQQQRRAESDGFHGRSPFGERLERL